MKYINKKKISIIALTTILGIGMFVNMGDSFADNTEENISSSTATTAMNEDGTVRQLTDEEMNASGIVEGAEEITAPNANARMARSVNVTNGVVNFRKSDPSKTTNYTEVNTGRTGYTCGSYAADAAYLEHTSDGKVKFMQAGVIGTVNASEVQVIKFSDAKVKTLSRYYVKNGTLYHGISTNLTSTSYTSTVNVGPKPSYLKEGSTYYSYDGHYFYNYNGGESGYATMLSDYRNNTRKQSVNPSNPYYNYYQYLSLRTSTKITATQFNNRVNNAVSTPSSSKMYNKGSSFVSAQNTYGINAGNMFGVAANESAYGTSSIAKTKNNIFGLNAVDSSPGQSANYYKTVDLCINEFAYHYMSKGYLNGNDYRYRGPHLGDKNSGINVKYASDPYWGEKAAAANYYTDTGKTDYGRYKIGVAKGTRLDLYKDANPSSTKIYNSSVNDGTRVKLYDYPVVILGSVKGTDGATWYKIQSDMPLKSDRSARDVTAKYKYSRDYVYAKASEITVVHSGNGSSGTTPTTPTPTYKKGDVNGDGKVEADDYMLIKLHVLGRKKLSGDALKRADVDKNGVIEASDYMLVKLHVLGRKPLF